MLELFLQDPSGTLLIVPSREHRRRLARRIAGQNRACFLPGLDTFQGLSKRLLHICKEFHPLWKDAERLWTLRQILRDMEREKKLVFLKGAAQNAGFLETLGDFVKELKHAEIFTPALRDALRRKGPDPKDQEILELYKRYQEMLVREGAYDQEGLLWQAKRLLQRGAKFPGIKTLLVDGFDSFTPTQLLFLQSLARGMEKTVLSLPPPSFAHVLKTRDQLHALFRLEEQTIQPVPVTDCIVPNDPNPRLQACADMAAEARLCAAQIKRLLADSSGGPWPSIAIYARHAKPYRELLEYEFRRHGLPPFTAKGKTLESSPLGTYLRIFMRAHAHQWGACPPSHQWRDDLLFLLDSPLSAKNPLRLAMPDPGAMRRRFEQAGITELCGDWKTRLGCKTPSETQSWSDYARSFADWPKEASASAHLAELQTRLMHWGVLDCLPEELQGHWEIFRHVMKEFAIFRDSRAAFAPQTLTLEDWLQELLPFLRQTGLPATAAAAGKPAGASVEGPCALMEGEEMRGASFDAVFLLGLNEGVFPANHRAHALYGASERLKMIEAGLDLQQDTDRDAQESFLFYQVLHSAQKFLFASWHEVDAQQREAFPSPFLREGGLLPPEAPASSPSARPWSCPADTLETLAANLFLPKSRRAGATDALLKLWMQRDENRTRAWIADAAWERQREVRRGFSDSDAQLRDAAILKDVRRRFGWDGVTSASKLTEYASCPHRFYARHVLGLESPEEPFGELDRKTRGTLVHDILWTLYQEHFQKRRPANTAAAMAAMQEDMPRVASSCFERLEQTHGILRPGLWAWEKGLMLSQLEAFLAYERQYFAQNPLRRPAYFELSFGMPATAATAGLPANASVEGGPQKADSEADPSSRPEPLRLTRGKSTLNIRGKIDRIDMEEFPASKGKPSTAATAGRPANASVEGFWVLDYKSGGKRVGPTDIRKGKDLQLPVYLFAARQWLEAMGVRAQPAGAALITTHPPEYQRSFIKNKKALASGSLDDGDWDETLEEARQKIFEYADQISAGRFTPTPGGNTCVRRCEYRGLCRYDERRIARKMPQ